MLRIRYRLDAGEWDRLLHRLTALRFRTALVGPHGSGKTTLLEDLQPRLEAMGFRVHWLRLSEENRSLPARFLKEVLPRLGQGDILLLDGAEQLSWWSWARLKQRSRRAGGLIIAAHRPGKLPTLRECATDPALLASIVRDLAGADGPICQEEAAKLFHLHQGNIRDVLRHLYDRWASDASSCPHPS